MFEKLILDYRKLGLTTTNDTDTYRLFFLYEFRKAINIIYISKDS